MKNLWNDQEAAACGGDLLKLRVYTSRLIGKEPMLVLHGGGNTSMKRADTNLFGEKEEVCYVKGSGWDLATIEPAGFSPVKMEMLLKLAKLEKLSDTDMVNMQKAAMTNPNAPAASVEAILHAIIPFAFVDHTHSDAVVAVSNTPGGLDRIKEIYGKKVIIIPYCMPGFILARKVFELTQDINWDQYEGMVLMNHGIFSFGKDAKTSYDRMISLVTLAEDYIKAKKVWDVPVTASATPSAPQPLAVAELRKQLSKEMKSAMIVKSNSSPEARTFSSLSNIASLATRGPLTPDHVIHTKRAPLMMTDSPENDVAKYVSDYRAYFEKNSKLVTEKLTCLDPVPRWAVWPGHGTLAFGVTSKKADIVADVNRHTMRSIQWSENMGGWTALPEKDIFECEYWDLEQAKLKKGGAALPLQGKIALVTGAASGIGKACVESLRAQGAAVAALDINPAITEQFKGSDLLGLVCDVTDNAAVKAAVEATVMKFGGLDIVVTNAGSFPSGKNISELDPAVWSKTIDINLNSHFNLLHACAPYLCLGVDPAVVVIASKNVPAPGPGASAYSSAKAGLTQLARVAALELGPKGVRVNVLHPNAVFDTGIWTDEVLANRAKHYGLSVEEYKTNNILRVVVTSKDVAGLACAMAGPLFGKTTGSQVAIDGGNDRVI